MRIRLACSGLLLPVLATLLAPPTPAPSRGLPDPVRYDRDIRPILADRCFKCHGPDPATREAKLRLDVRDDALAARDGTAAIVPGDPDASELIRRVEHADPDEVMPPKKSDKRPLTADDKALLRRWIQEGAHYEAHWSFVPPVRPTPPAAPAGYPVHNEVDRFLAANLARHGVPTSPPADQATLCRRVFLTLTGLPPTPEELQAFTNDSRPDAYERLVDRLLNEEPWRSRFAERFASQWLDAARYADTSGIHMDAGRQIWPWRDWVLRALRDDLPFDRFVTEQIAGDLLPNATQDQIIASGFHRNHVTTDEGGAIDEEYRVEYAVDRTATTGSVLLGLTLGCARCHEHKYDPITHDDFYRVYAFFNTNDEPGLYSQIPDANRALEPFLTVATPELQQQITGVQQELATAREQLAATDPEETAKIRTFLDGLVTECGLAWTTPPVTRATSDGGATQQVQSDGSVLASGANPARDVVRLRLRTEATDQRLLCLEALTDASLPGGKVGRAPNGNAVLQSIEVTAVSTVDPEQRQPVRLAWAWADIEQADGDYKVVNALANDDNRGWAVAAHQRPPGPRRALFLAEQPFGFAGGTELEVALHYDSVYAEHAFGRVRVSISGLAEAGLARLPEALSGWYLAAPFPGPDPYETAHGPELPGVDLKQSFGKVKWRHQDRFAEGKVNGGLPEGAVVNYVATRVFAPTARTRKASLGSDDGFQLYVNGQRVAENRVDRGVAADQDRADVPLPAGHSLLVMKVINTGGAGGFYLRREPRDGELSGDLPLALLPGPAQDEATTAALTLAWRLRFSPDYARRKEAVTGLEQRLRDLENQQPKTMVMKEAATPRQTYVLLRGEYDKPDTNRPMSPSCRRRWARCRPAHRQPPPALRTGSTPTGQPAAGAGAVNRLWEFVFGVGIVRTSEDFGLQGEWPSHPELVDWLALELRDHGSSACARS
ncbi:MAG: DUF1549 domain-containing protein [Planctomycetes bacterium]|nr:DUF1549 domain-containing protein [Planctomycetota bacterium]